MLDLSNPYAVAWFQQVIDCLVDYYSDWLRSPHRHHPRDCTGTLTEDVNR